MDDRLAITLRYAGALSIGRRPPRRYLAPYTPEMLREMLDTKEPIQCTRPGCANRPGEMPQNRTDYGPMKTLVKRLAPFGVCGPCARTLDQYLKNERAKYEQASDKFKRADTWSRLKAVCATLEETRR